MPALRTLARNLLLQWFRFPYAVRPKAGFSVRRSRLSAFRRNPSLDSPWSSHPDVLAAARDDDLVAELVQCFSKATTNTCAPAGDEDGVFGEFHRGFLNLKLMDKLVQPVKLSPNMGSPLLEDSRLASSSMTSQCSARRSFSILTISAAIQATGGPCPEKRPWTMT